GEADVLVHAAVAGHVVQVEELIVVGAGRLRTGGDDVIGIGNERIAEVVDRIGAMGNVDQELVAGAEGADRRRVDRGGRVALDEQVVGGVQNAVGTETGN